MSGPISAGRALWLSEHVLPCEAALRAWLKGHMSLQQDVDDVIQETWAIIAALDDVGHIRQPRAYVYQVAKSVVLQQLRRAQVVSIEAVAEIDRLTIGDVEPCPEGRASAHQELARVSALIAALPDKCREAFVLRRVEGYSQREIAQRMNISENTVEKHICKGVRVLMDALRQERQSPPGEERKVTPGGVADVYAR